MTPKPHPTDAMEMPEPEGYKFSVPGISKIDTWPHGGNWFKLFSEKQLRAERIKTYDLGRQEALEDAAKHFCAKRHGCEMFCGEIEDELRSLKL